MITFRTVDEYLYFMAGIVDINLNAISYPYPIQNKKLSLSKKDFKPLHTMAKQSYGGVGLTDRQLQFAVILILKYKKQMSKQGVDVSVVDADYPLSYPVRIINRESTLTLDHNTLILKFQYNDKLIQTLFEIKGDTAQGNMNWNKEKEIWEIALTEGNLLAIVELAVKYNIKVSDEIKELWEAVAAISETYKIELTRINNKLVIANAADSLIEHLETRYKIEEENLFKLCDLGPEYGYTVSDLIKDELADIVNANTLAILESKNIKFDRSVELEELLEYAARANRSPVVIFAPGAISVKYGNKPGYFLSKEDNEPTVENIKRYLSKYFTSDEIDVILTVKQSKDWTYNPDVKIIFTTKILNIRPELLISLSGYMFGPKRQTWLSEVPKIIYWCDHVLEKQLD